MFSCRPGDLNFENFVRADEKSENWCAWWSDQSLGPCQF